MAQTQITYTDKVLEGGDPTGQFQVTDANQIKTVVNANAVDVTSIDARVISLEGGAASNSIATSFFNDTGSTIAKGKYINAMGIDATNEIVKGVLANSASLAFSSAVIGITLESVANGAVGVAYRDIMATGIDTSAQAAGGPLYLSTSGGVTGTRPTHPANIVIVGTVVHVDASVGKQLVQISPFRRRDASRSYSFTSQGVGAGVYNKSGFYEWESNSITLNQGSLTQTLGAANLTRAGHVGVIPSGAGTVDTGQVGLRVTGTLDSESGVQVAAQTQDITDDITTLTVDVLAETVGKFSGQVTLELYTVSGSPATYAVTFNYGFSKYTDFSNKSATITGIECDWLGGGADSSFNIRLRAHRTSGWTYAASGFVAGNGILAERLVDQAINSSVASGENGAWKRVDLNEYLDGSASEGFILEVTTGSNNTIQTMDMNLIAVSEELD